MSEQQPYSNSKNNKQSEQFSILDEYYFALVSGDQETIKLLRPTLEVELEVAQGEYTWLINSMHYAFARSTDCQIRSHPDSKTVNEVVEDLWNKIQLIEQILT